MQNNLINLSDPVRPTPIKISSLPVFYPSTISPTDISVLDPSSTYTTRSPRIIPEFKLEDNGVVNPGDPVNGSSMDGPLWFSQPGSELIQYPESPINSYESSPVSSSASNISDSTTASPVLREGSLSNIYPTDKGQDTTPTATSTATTKTAKTSGIAENAASKAATTTKTSKKRGPRRRLTQTQKIAHNKIEKKYRTNINEKITSLNEVIPEDWNDGNSYTVTGRANKSAILERAAAYICYLQNAQLSLEEENRLLRDISGL